MGYLYRRGNIWWAKYYRNGIPIRESTGTEKEKEAENFLKVREGKVAMGEPVLPKLDRIRYEEAAEDLRRHYRTTGKRNLDGEAEYHLKHLDRFFKRYRLAAIGPAQASQYVAERQTKGAANATINRELAVLRRMLNLAYRNGKLLRMPVFEMLKEPPPREGFFEADQFGRVLQHLPSYLRPAVTFAYLTGWRKREVLGLSWERVDFENGVIRLDPGTTKSGAGRVFPLFPELEAVLLTLGRAEGCPWVFHHKGRPIRDYYRAWRSTCMKADLPGRIFHDLRRTAARNMLRAGVQEKHAMALVGHKTRSMLDRYNIVVERDLTEAGRKLTGTFPGTVSAFDLDPRPVNL